VCRLRDFCGTQSLIAVITRADHQSVLRQANPVRTVQFYCFKIHSNIILACIPKAFRFQARALYTLVVSTMRAEHLQPFLPWFRNSNCLWLEAPSYQFSVSSYILGPHIVLCTETHTVMRITERNLCYFPRRFNAFPSIFNLCLLYNDEIKESKKQDILNPYAELNENMTVL
jgi:hypothetical protein